MIELLNDSICVAKGDVAPSLRLKKITEFKPNLFSIIQGYFRIIDKRFNTTRDKLSKSLFKKDLKTFKLIDLPIPHFNLTFRYPMRQSFYLNHLPSIFAISFFLISRFIVNLVPSDNSATLPDIPTR